MPTRIHNHASNQTQNPSVEPQKLPEIFMTVTEYESKQIFLNSFISGVILLAVWLIRIIKHSQFSINKQNSEREPLTLLIRTTLHNGQISEIFSKSTSKIQETLLHFHIHTTHAANIQRIPNSIPHSATNPSSQNVSRHK